MKSVCVFCGSSSGTKPEYARSAFSFGRTLAESGYDLVYGGGSVGMMGHVADGALECGGRVVGVIPYGLANKERMHMAATEMLKVESMHQRKAKMAELSDAFVALPGGMGTMEEFTEIFTWGQLGIHKKPFGLLNVEGYFTPFISFLDHMVDEGFLRASDRALVQVSSDAEALLSLLADFVPPSETIWNHEV